MVLQYFVTVSDTGNKIPVDIDKSTADDLSATKENWQTDKAASINGMPRLGPDINAVSFNFEENKIKNTCCKHFNDNSNGLIFYKTSETLPPTTAKRCRHAR